MRPHDSDATRKQTRREQSLDTLMLLSALESWAFSQETRLPDYLHDRLSAAIEVLRAEVLHNEELATAPCAPPVVTRPPWEVR